MYLIELPKSKQLQYVIATYFSLNLYLYTSSRSSRLAATLHSSYTASPVFGRLLLRNLGTIGVHLCDVTEATWIDYL